MTNVTIVRNEVKVGKDISNFNCKQSALRTLVGKLLQQGEMLEADRWAKGCGAGGVRRETNEWVARWDVC